jgi:aerobic carbon-monoxide dehydrogenase medium subunit
MYPFAYQRASTARDAVAAFAGDARYLAGGQSLVQAMKLRLSQAERLVDLRDATELRGICIDGDTVVVGAMTPHAEVAASADVRMRLPALAVLAGGIGDPMVRNRGTMGGSIANADPAACYPAGLLALDATVQTDRRRIAAADFFTGFYATALEPGELIKAVHFPVPQRAGYAKHRQPASRFALVGVFVSQGPQGVRVAVTGAQSQVYRCGPLEAALSQRFTAAAARAVRLPSDDIQSDLHAPAEYRAAMISAMAARAVDQALGA